MFLFCIISSLSSGVFRNGWQLTEHYVISVRTASLIFSPLHFVMSSTFLSDWPSIYIFLHIFLPEFLYILFRNNSDSGCIFIEAIILYCIGYMSLTGNSFCCRTRVGTWNRLPVFLKLAFDCFLPKHLKRLLSSAMHALM